MENKSTIIAKLLPIKGEIKAGSKVIHKDLSLTGAAYHTVKYTRDGIAIVEFSDGEELFIQDLLPVGMCAVETDFKAPCKVIAISTHAFAKFGEKYKLKEQRERGTNNFVVLVKGFEKIGDFYKKAKADDLRKPLWMKKEVFGINLGEISEKAIWVTDGMSINIKTSKSLLGSIEPKLNAQNKITVMCDQCESYH